MIALIIGVILFISGVALLICGVKYGDDGCVGGGVIFTIVPFAFVLLALLAGASIYKTNTKKKLEEKRYIEYCLETQPSYYVIQEAEHYNNSIERGNNYFCRFNIEDRSEFIINIDDYLKDAE